MLIEVNCESDFVARTDDFQELVHDLAMQVAAADPQFVRREDVTAGGARQRERHPARPRLAEGKPEKMVDKIVEGRMTKYYEEVCLLEQPFIKENTTLTVAELIKTKIAKLGENISVARFVRFKVGETQQAADAAGGTAVKRPPAEEARAPVRSHSAEAQRRGARRAGQSFGIDPGAREGAGGRSRRSGAAPACRSAWSSAAATSFAAWRPRRRTWIA